jgi:D-alanyl-D-alanine carboxypeptidase (penicillin-binding protein 5/6)
LQRLVVLVVVGCLLIAVDVIATRRISVPPAEARTTSTLAPVVAASGPSAPLPWPATGQGAVAIPLTGYVAQSGTETAVPVASLTKLMTAYLILRDHPLNDGLPGPSITMTQQDVTDFDNDTGQDESSIAVSAGEVLTERQVLDGLLVHSANNFADTLAVWDSGSIAAFVAKMNATAAALGMTQTHYVDDSGFDPQSMSTAGDILKVASLDMEYPAFVQAVAMPSVTLPVSGLVSTYTPLLGTNGVIGVKSGFTSQAGGCDVMAVVRPVGNRSVIVLAAVTGQQAYDALTAAGNDALALVNAAAAQLHVVPVLRAGLRVGTTTVGGMSVPVRATGAAEVVAWPGQVVQRSLAMASRVTTGTPAGTVVGTADAVLGTQREQVGAVLTRSIPAPSVRRRLF